MSVAISRYEPLAAPADAAAPPRLERGDGAAEIAFARRGAATVLARLYQRTPCRVLFPLPEPGDLPMAALLTTSGGLAGGDRLRLSITAEAGARAVAATVAAEKVYRSLGPETVVEVALDVGADGWLEWLPQETILFDGARVKRRIAADLAPDAKLLAAETLVFGRIARGERFARGLLHESWRVRLAGKLVWADALRLEGDIAARLASPTAFAGASALATAIYVGADAAEHLPLARALTDSEPCRGGATLVNGMLLARFFGERAAAVRAALARYLSALRQAAAGLPPALPRLWAT